MLELRRANLSGTNMKHVEAHRTDQLMLIWSFSIPHSRFGGYRNLCSWLYTINHLSWRFHYPPHTFKEIFMVVVMHNPNFTRSQEDSLHHPCPWHFLRYIVKIVDAVNTEHHWRDQSIWRTRYFTLWLRNFIALFPINVR